MTNTGNIRCFLFENPDASELPPLSGKEIHIWRVQTADSRLLKHAEILSDEEQERALRYRNEDARQCYQTGHTALRLLLSHYLGEPAESFTFTCNEQKKPALANMNSIHFNISHSGDWIVLAFAAYAPVGIDIEYARDTRRTDLIVKRFFHPDEAALYQALSESERQRFFYEHWTAREAALKALGIGLTVETNTFLVEDLPDGETLRIVGGPAGSEALLLSRFDCPDGYTGCIAYCADTIDFLCCTGLN